MRAHAEFAVRALPAWPPLLRAATGQGVACLAMALLGAEQPLSLAGQALLAAALGGLLGLPRWWIPLNLAFPPAVMMATAWSFPASAYLAGFLLLAGVYGLGARSQAPLFLSGINACAALSALLPAGRGFRFLDAGCGVGTTLAWLAPRHLSGCFEGVEVAAVPAGLAWLRARLSGGLFSVRRDDLWSLRFADYDVVYAFLSPVPMNALLNKARREMRPGSVLVSNTFLPDGPPPSLSLPLPGRGRALHVWRF